MTKAPAVAGAFVIRTGRSLGHILRVYRLPYRDVDNAAEPRRYVMMYTISNTLPFHFGGAGMTPSAAASCGISS